MREIIISEITLMRESFCVIGLERREDRFVSIRPVPWGGGGWIQFPYERGDWITFDFDAMPATFPHIEDMRAAHPRRVGAISESELVDCLKRAEVAGSARELFGCYPHAGAVHGAYVPAQSATRSICGCKVTQVGLHWQGQRMGGRLALPSGDTLNDLPVVDRDWREFIHTLQDQHGNAPNFSACLQQFLNGFISRQIANSPIRFARIGLAREDAGHNWMMLDSLFPLPKREWLSEFTD
jgi:hypothetical protein